MDLAFWMIASYRLTITSYFVDTIETFGDLATDS